MKRIFHPGEEWLYLRLFMGPETADFWLSNVLPGLYIDIFQQGLVRKCFFLRYLNPGFHLRVRFELVENEYFGLLVKKHLEASANLMQEKMIWKSEIGSYEREMGRYGQEWIEKAEMIFSEDSIFWLKILPGFWSNTDGEDIRWQAALLSAHYYLGDFIIGIDQRIELLNKMIQTLSREIGGGKKLRLQISEKYRKHRSDLESILVSTDGLKLYGFEEAIKLRSRSISEIPMISEIVSSWEESVKEARVSDLIHMSLNRGLRSKHRMHELVIYSFLRQLYISGEARR